MNNLVRRALTAILVVFAYICVHEMGHLLAAMTFGRAVAEVRLVSLKPGIFLYGPAPAGEQAIVAGAGSGLVVALWFGFFSVRRAGPPSFAADCLTFLTGIELLAWFLSAATRTVAPAGNDVTKFLDFSNLNPAVVVCATGLLAIGGAGLYSRSSKQSAVASCNAAFPGQGQDRLRESP